MTTVDPRWAAVAEGVVTRTIRECLADIPISSPNIIARAVLGSLADLGGEAWPDTAPRSWSLPPEPGPEVTAVRCACCNVRWFRANRPRWRTVWEREGSMFGYLTWRALLIEHAGSGAELTDASAEVQ